MIGFHRLDDPLPLPGLLALEYDGLLQRMTDEVWVEQGTIPDPALRSRALGSPPRPRVALSHRSAHWVWWGSASGRAPALVEYTTLSRRRMRASTCGWTVYERDVPPPERLDVAGTWVTSPERTLFDLFRDAVVAPDPESAARHTLARVPAGDRSAFLVWLDRIERRPFIARIRALSRSTVHGTAPSQDRTLEDPPREGDPREGGSLGGQTLTR